MLIVHAHIQHFFVFFITGLALTVACMAAHASPADRASAPGLAAAHLPDPERDAMRLLEETRSKIKMVRSVKAEFVQEKVLSMLTEPVVSKGTFLYKGGRKFSWHYLPPDESFTISDGKRIWIYFPALKQVEVYDLEKFKTRSRLFEKLCLGFERPLCDLADAFSIRLIAETEGDFEVLLRPKEDAVARAIEEIRVVLSKQTGLPTQIRTLEKNGDTTTIRFTEVAINQRLPDTVFDFQPPAGVEVIKQRPLSY